MHRGSPYLSAGFKNNIHRKTHACNQTDFCHQNNCKGERHWQSPCNHICQVSNEELKLQSFGCQRPLTGGKYTCDDTQYIKSKTSWLWCYIWYIQRCLASVAFLALQFVCLHMLCIHAGLCFCDGHYETGTSKLLTYWKVVSIFQSLPLSCQEALPFSLFIFIYLFFTPPSVYLIIIVAWVIFEREELSFDKQTLATNKTQKRNFILIPNVNRTLLLQTSSVLLLLCVFCNGLYKRD